MPCIAFVGFANNNKKNVKLKLKKNDHVISRLAKREH